MYIYMKICFYLNAYFAPNWRIYSEELDRKTLVDKQHLIEIKIANLKIIKINRGGMFINREWIKERLKPIFLKAAVLSV